MKKALIAFLLAFFLSSYLIADTPPLMTITAIQGTPAPSSSPWPVTVVSPIPLQATAVLQNTGNTSLATIATNTTGVSTAANQVTIETTLSSINTVQSSGTQKTQIVDGSGNVIGSSSNNLYVGNGATYKTLTTAATTTLKSGAGILFTVCINSIANGTVLTLYDNTAGSGNVIMAPSVVTGGLGLGAYVQTPICLSTGGVIFSTGLTAVVTGTGPSFSVYWK